MSHDNFGLKIGVEGEREFKKNLAEINQAFKVLGSEMQLVTSQFDKDCKCQAKFPPDSIKEKSPRGEQEKRTRAC